MNICGVVAEFNPFHNGHRYLLEQIRNQLGEDTVIIAAMSGNFVQRGEPSVFDKFSRTAAALHGGVDMVFEIPVEYALGSAAVFAQGAVKTLIDCGVVTHIAFGSECGDISLINQTASAINDEQVISKTKQILTSGITYAAARQKAVEEIFGKKTADVLGSANDILAVEYVSFLNKQNSSIKPIAIKRIGGEHDAKESTGDFSSASLIREMINNNADYNIFVPEKCAEIYDKCIKSGRFSAYQLEFASRIMLDRLRGLDVSDFERLNDASEGLHNRIYNMTRTALSLEKLTDEIKTKRYTHARIRRLLISAALGIYDLPNVPYLRLLGFNKSGEAVLKIMKSNSAKPIVTSFSSAKKVSEQAKQRFLKDSQKTDFYNLLTHSISPCDDELVQAVVKI